MLAEAQAAFAAANPYGHLAQAAPAAPPVYVPPPLAQEQMVGAGFGGTER
jgi:hypothetical protein